MWIYWILAVVAGLLGVVQSGFTQKLAKPAGLANALHISNLVVLIGGLVVLTLILKFTSGDFAKVLRGRSELKGLGWWLVVPGLCGLFMITVSPFALGRIGALPVFVSMIFGQVVGSALWDWQIEQTPIDRYRVAGIVLSLLSMVSIGLSSSNGGVK